MDDRQKPKRNEKRSSGVDRTERETEVLATERLKGRVVGKDVPDESKERHTEIAVEAGKRGTRHN